MLSCNDSIRFRMRFIAVLTLPIAVLLAVRLYFVQVVNYDRMYDKARRQYTSVRVTSGKRGEIFDVSGNLLVGNAPCERVSADPSLVRSLQQRRAMSYLLSSKLSMDYQDVFERLAPERQVFDSNGSPVRNPDGSLKVRKMRGVTIANNVPLELAAELRNAAQVNHFDALFFREGYMRTYPKGKLLANVLGFTSMDGASVTPVLGVEKFFDQQMASGIGRELYERDRTGYPLPYGLHESVQSKDGANVYLTIDEPMQAIMEEELDAAYEKWRPKALYAVMADPRNGNVLAIAQRPTFNPNDRRRISPDAWRIRIIEDGLEPGSIMKPFTVGGALDAGTIRADSQFDCENGLWMYLGKPLRDSHPNGMMTVADIIKTSSNIGTAKIALQFGANNVYNTLRKFGFGQPTGLPLKPEALGIMPPVKKWDGLSITRFPIGYSILVSPVQMVRAYCALANHGWLPKLRLVDRLENPETGEVQTIPAEPAVQVFRHSGTCRTLVDMMVRVTGDGGTARRAAIPGYHVAGKTGTSRKYIKGQGYLTKYFASFVGFVPAERPAFVMLVTVDEPQGGNFGGTVAAPIFRSIAEKALRHLNIRPDPSLLKPPAVSGKDT